MSIALYFLTSVAALGVGLFILKTAKQSKTGKVDGRKDYITANVPGLSISVFKSVK